MSLDFISGYVLGSRQRAKATGMASSAATFASSPASKVHDIGDRVDRLVLVVEAMWSLLEESGYTREQLEDRIVTMDSADGAADGKATRQRLRCPKCDSAVMEGTGRCQICGESVGEENPFAGI